MVTVTDATPSIAQCWGDEPANFSFENRRTTLGPQESNPPGPMSTKAALPGLVIQCDHEPHPEHRLPDLTAEEAAWRHGSWRHHRHLTHQALMAINPIARSLYNFCHCGCLARVEIESETREVRVINNACKHRMCLPCRRRVAGTIRDNLYTECLKRRMRSVTLTLRHSPAPLKDQIRRLFRCFAALRRRKAVKTCITGGAYVLEIKVSSKDGFWHPHLHIVTEGTYIPQKLLSLEWLAVTKDSDNVHISAVTDARRDVDHHTKYITKIADASVYEDQKKLVEYIDAMHGVRAYSTFGSWRGIKLTARKPESGTWVVAGWLTTIIRKSKQGDLLSQNIIKALESKHDGSSTQRHPNASGP